MDSLKANTDEVSRASMSDPEPPARAKTHFLEIAAPYFADAYHLARWLTGSRTDAEDVVQEASIRALRGISSFANGNARAWFLTIVRNTAYDWLRKNRSGVLVFLDDLEKAEGADIVEPDAVTPESALMEMQESTLLRSAIAALPTHFRETLVLREMQGLSYREIADMTGISIGTTMSRLFRARRHLIANLKRQGAPCAASV